MRNNVSWLCLPLFVAVGCGGGGSGDTKPDTCKNSICGPASGGTSGTGATSGGSGGSAARAAAAGKGGSQTSTGGSANATGAQGGSAGTVGGDAGADSGATGGSGGSANAASGGSTGSGGSSASGGATGGGGTGGGAGGAGGGGTGGSGGCQGDACGAVAQLDMDFYQCNVEPILDRSCAMLGCHGSEKRPFRMYARGRLRHDEDLTLATNPAASGCVRSGTVNLAEMGTGTIMCEGWTHHTDTEWQMNFDSASSFMRVNMSPDDSELLSQPTVGGLPHVNVHPFQKDDDSYTLIRRWLAGETLGRPCAPEFN